MALDSILSNALLSTPPKTISNGAGAMAGMGNTDRAIDTTNTTGRSGMTGGGGMADSAGSAGTRDPANGHGSGNHSPGHSTADSSSSSNHTKSADKRPTAHSSSGSGSSSARTHGSASSRSKTNTAQASSQAQGTRGTTGARKSAAGAQQQNTPASFGQALAQLQADAAANADAVDATEAAAAASEDPTGSGDKPKAARPGQSEDNTAAALAFLPQSLAAVVAATQAHPVQTPPPAPGLMDSPGESTDSADDSTSAVTASGSSSASQTALADLGTTATETKPVAPDVSAGLKADSAAGTTPDGITTATDATNAAAAAFQAHMSISSHFQTPAAATAHDNKVNAAVGTPAFNDELGGKITWMASQNQGLQSASLQLSPEHMGPVNVHISVQDGSATVSFNAAHADTRAALEQALPRLREMFAAQGLTLTDASVSHQSPRGQPQKQPVSSINATGGVSGESNATSITSVVSARLGLVDTYA